MFANEFRFKRDEKSGLTGPASCNTLDFHTRSFGQGTDLHYGSGRPMFGEMFGVDIIELGKIFYICNKDIDSRHLIKVASCGQYYLPEVFQSLVCLWRKIRAYQLTGFRLYSELTTYKEPGCCRYALGLWSNGSRCSICLNNFTLH